MSSRVWSETVGPSPPVCPTTKQTGEGQVPRKIEQALLACLAFIVLLVLLQKILTKMTNARASVAQWKALYNVS